MGVTINVNGLSLCHQGSDGLTIATAPDVCKTPPVPVPIPYPNIAFSSDLAKGTTTVTADGGHSIAVRGSEFAKSTGDEPGNAGGVVSGTFTKEATWITFSADVFFEGRSACRLTDKMLHNHGNTWNCAGELQAPVPGGGPQLPEPCKTLFDEMMDLIFRNKRLTGDGGTHGLLYRFQEQIHGKSGPGTVGWQTHEQTIKNQQQGLRRRLNDWDRNGCGPPPPNAWDWATKPVPTAKEWQDPNASSFSTGDAVKTGAGVAAGAGALYVGYRIIRFLPSLFPPLWETIPLNLAVP